ncbi:MAG TPA: lamin tail domain-containing protein, partial [Polyangiaceae bacterium]|nr:lamin tail domain-containing protein [Polyangiaceae bacterium]
MKSEAGSGVAGLLVALGLLAACSGGNIETSNVVHRCAFSLGTARSGSASHPLRINEVMTGNDGAWVDEQGETDDFIELINTGSRSVSLSGYALGDKSGKATTLPDVEVDAGATVLLWADDTPSQGALHLPFKLSNSGTPVLLWASDSCELVDHVSVPELPRSESYARLPDGDGELQVCRYATPERANGESCEPPPPPNLSDSVTFEPYEWPVPYLAPAGPLVLSELALAPARFVEVLNAGKAAVDLADYQLKLAPLPPGAAWPGADEGAELAWPVGATTLEPGERVVVPVTDADAAELQNVAEQEGVVTVWQSDGLKVSDRVDFMAWPEGAALARLPDAVGPLRFCETASPGEANDSCVEVEKRALPGGRAHRLATDADFATLAEGGTEVGDEAVKFVVDMQA